MTKRSLILLAIATTMAMFPSMAADTETAAVLKVEDAFRQAKLKNDVKALGEILASYYNGVNQWGAARDKSSLLELFQTFRIDSLVNLEAKARVSGDSAIVEGTMSESGPGGDFQNLLFTRVYVKREGRWQLWSSYQMMPMPRP